MQIHPQIPSLPLLVATYTAEDKCALLLQCLGLSLCFREDDCIRLRAVWQLHIRMLWQRWKAREPRGYLLSRRGRQRLSNPWLECTSSTKCSLDDAVPKKPEASLVQKWSQLSQLIMHQRLSHRFKDTVLTNTITLHFIPCMHLAASPFFSPGLFASVVPRQHLAGQLTSWLCSSDWIARAYSPIK